MESGQIMVELAPPSRRASFENQKKSLERMVKALRNLPRVDLVNVPEIVSENHEGTAFYEKVDVSEFAVQLKDQTGVPVAVNKVTVHLTGNAFEKCLQEAQETGRIDRFVFVGGNRSSIQYMGISVLEANRLAKKRGCVFGNIAIAERSKELSRLLEKTRTGCSFFTTQILFESGPLKSLLFEYEHACIAEGLKPAAFYLCFAPVTENLDLEYVQWLGAKIPDSVKARLSEHDAASASVALAQKVYSDVLTFSRDQNLTVPLNISIEPVSTHNLDWMEPMIRSLNGVRHLF